MERFLMEAGPLIFPVILLVLVIVGLATRNALALMGKMGTAVARGSSIFAILFWGSVAVLILMEAGPLSFLVILLILVISGLAIRKSSALKGREGTAVARRSSIDAILFWGCVAALIGFLGQWIGVMKMLSVMVEHGLVSPDRVVYGLSVSLLTPGAGRFVLVGSAFLWFFLRVGLWAAEGRS